MLEGLLPLISPGLGFYSSSTVQVNSRLMTLMYTVLLLCSRYKAQKTYIVKKVRQDNSHW